MCNALGYAGNITYNGESSFNEYLYTYGGTVPNGGAYSITQGIFTQSLWYMTHGYTLTIENWVHYNGTYGASSSCSGC